MWWLGSSVQKGQLIEIFPRAVFGPRVTYSIPCVVRSEIQSTDNDPLPKSFYWQLWLFPRSLETWLLKG